MSHGTARRKREERKLIHSESPKGRGRKLSGIKGNRKEATKAHTIHAHCTKDLRSWWWWNRIVTQRQRDRERGEIRLGGSSPPAPAIEGRIEGEEDSHSARIPRRAEDRRRRRRRQSIRFCSDFSFDRRTRTRRGCIRARTIPDKREERLRQSPRPARR